MNGPQAVCRLVVEADAEVPPGEARSQRVCKQGLGIMEPRNEYACVLLRTHLLGAWENPKLFPGRQWAGRLSLERL